MAHKKIKNILSKYIDMYDKNDKFNFIGYNSHSFDLPFLRSWFLKCGDKFFGSWFWNPSIDVMILWAFILNKKRSNLPNFKLTTVAKYVGIYVDETQLHDALYDIELTIGLFKKVKVYLK